MSTFDTHGNKHAVAGTPGGGRFETQAKAEPETTLGGTGNPEMDRTIETLRTDLAGALGANPADLHVETQTGFLCGEPAGSGWVRLEYETPQRTVRLVTVLLSDGTVQRGEVELVSEWSDGYAEAKYTDWHQSMAQTVADLNAAEKIQWRLDAEVPDRSGSRVDLRAKVDGGVKSLIAKGTSPYWTATLDIADDGTITGGSLSTHGAWGSLDLTGDNLDQVARQVEHEVQIARREYDTTENLDRTALEERTRRLFAD